MSEVRGEGGVVGLSDVRGCRFGREAPELRCQIIVLAS